MQYRKDKKGEDISILGYGCMRFSRRGGSIDLDKAEREILKAIDCGVNYFDTAYIYPGSEAALGEILSRNNVRDKVKIATKLPQYILRNGSDFNKYFNEELRRLKTDRIDYYLMHMLTDLESWRKLTDMGIQEWLEAKRKNGQILNIGFSFHGSTDMFLKILDCCDWDFCQIQYNYVDERSQAGREGLHAAASKGIPVIIMEPLRGGKLVNMLPSGAKELFQQSGRGWSCAEWGLRWLWNQPEVTCVLSGMNSLDMVSENCRIADEVKESSLTEEDLDVLSRVKNEIRRSEKVPCTGCGYCMPCPKGVDIPGAFRCYNQMYIEKKGVGRREYWQTVALRKEPAFPSQCVGCRRCEQHCPQHIEISAHLKAADRALRPLPYKIAAGAAKKFMFHRRKK